MRLFILFIFLFSSLLLAKNVEKDAKQEKVKISVMELKAESGIDKGVVSLLYEIILTEFQSYSNISVISKTDISSMVQYETEKELAGCDDTSCMSEIGGALGVDKIVSGHIGKLGGSYIVNLKLMNIKDAVVENRVSETIPADESKLIPLVKFLSNKLLVQYKDHKKGVAQDFTKHHEASNGSSKLFTWISLGVGASLAIAGGVYHFTSVAPYHDDFVGGKLSGTYDELNDSYQTKQIVRNTLLISGGTLLVTGVVLFFIEGEGEKKGNGLTVSPFVTNDSFFVNTSFSF